MCTHINTFFSKKPWPDGEAIEICKDCGMSRAHWGQDVSNWLVINTTVERKRFKKALRDFIK